MNGSSEFIDFKISKNINRYEIPNVEQYIEDLIERRILIFWEDRCGNSK